ncbi:hypothetical protein BKA82DRAFT_511941 [Pisolithus tinctorius]|uniref:Uncharacterized protein n=1 Tax=Pisolithus tinctorius Marx 270 TaxID=870435 RepID=A0A0C3PBZ9_PISTI|nr:hypothetical protein BKA82DRAFT_511941 [Pisolithus tinctorius]KIO05516.1 hypothetical protein M404DRAFT_511941 [Pisolithus tinctorius Marx 270]
MCGDRRTRTHACDCDARMRSRDRCTLLILLVTRYLGIPVARREANRVLLTIGRSPPSIHSFYRSYHPPIFKPLSSFTPANPLQASLLKLAAVGMSVYSPPTTLDSVRGGIHDFLASDFSI